MQLVICFASLLPAAPDALFTALTNVSSGRTGLLLQQAETEAINAMPRSHGVSSEAVKTRRTVQIVHSASLRHVVPYEATFL
jgi:hypothetical protein